MKQHAFLYNPAARAGRSNAQLQKLKKLIEPKPHIRLFIAEYQGHIGQLVEELWDDYEVFVACGGDGTVQEVARKLVYTDKVLGIIPLGTGNDLCKTLRIPLDLEEAFEIIEEKNSIEMDAGRCNNIFFLNSLGFGFDGLTNRYAAEYQSLPPLLRYTVAALRSCVNHNRISAEINRGDRTESRDLIMFSLANGRVEGGMFWIAPGASITDGRLNMVTIRPLARLLIPLLLPLFLIKKPGWIPQVESEEVESVVVKFEQEVELHADGEIIDTGERQFAIEVLPAALQVFIGL